MSNKNQQRQRFTALDEARAIAILGMILFHFGEGAFQRLPKFLSHWLGEPLLFLGRFATPAFVTVFGLTAGFVYFSSTSRPNLERFQKILHRAMGIALGAIIITIPKWINLSLESVSQPNLWLFSFYGVLNFYALAFLSLPLWLALLWGRPTWVFAVLGVGMWVLGDWLSQVWQFTPGWRDSPKLEWSEYFRMHLASGPYAYFQLAGYAMCLFPLGIALKKAASNNTLPRFLPKMMLMGFGMTIVGAIWGITLGQLTLSDIVRGTYKAPPRAWYFLFFGGFAVILVALLALSQSQLKKFVPQGTYILGLFGQCALPIYVGQAFVLPVLNWLDAFFLIEGIFRIILPLGFLVAYCAVLIWRKHLTSRACG